MAVIAPCEWAECAKNKKDEEFTLTHQGSSRMVTVALVQIRTMDVGGGYTGYTFSFEHNGSECEDGMYTVKGGGCSDSELFVVASHIDGLCHYVISLVCQA